MTSIAELSVRLLRTAALTAAVVVTAGVAGAHAQALNPKPHTDTTAPATPVGPPIRQIVVQGTQRIETATVLSYISIREGDPYDEQAVDRSLKTLFATGLFADVKFRWDGATLSIQVVENPIINQIEFEGNDKVSDQGSAEGSADSSRVPCSRATACSPTCSASSNSIAATANSPPASIPRSSSARRTASI